MQLYIGNPTRQPVVFAYRRLENTKVIRQHITYGGQIKVSGDLSPEDVQYIVGQYRKYGIVKADDTDSRTDFVDICYSVDKPISSIRLERILQRNQFVLVERGKKFRKEAAIAEGVRMEQAIVESGRPERMTGFETTITEHVTDGGTPTLNEGIRVSRNANPDGSVKEPSAKPRGRRAKQA